MAVVCLALSGPSSAAVLDLTLANDNGFIGGAFFTTNQQQSTGTGNIQPFLRIQGAPTEVGYNTGNNTKEFQTKDDGWTQAIQLGQIPEITVNGVVYREFLVDINESGSDKTIFLSLDYLQIFLGATSTALGYSGSAVGGTDPPTLAGTSLVYDMGTGNHVLTNYALNPGSGAGDLFIYIPTTLFGSNPNLWLYMFAGFGFNGSDWVSNDGFEEIAVRSVTPGTPVPEPGTMALLGSGLVGLASWGRKKFRK